MINYIKLGFYHPSNANWSYGIWLIVDDTGAKLYRETFGGDSRMAEQVKNRGYKILKLGVMAWNKYKWSDVKIMPDIEEYTGRNY